MASASNGSAFVLSAREESTLLGHLVAVLEVCAHCPGHADDAGEHQAHDGRVAFPVGGLGVPTSGRRPDVLGVSAAVSEAQDDVLGPQTYGILLPPPPMIAIECAGSWGRGAGLT
jgi:hypothetical protein